ncbi:MAG: hypothetical protein K2K69_10745 [Muribaculaceae bacterium]|nr:hypothetical protein [Muribaculaceae bacterium]
MKKLLFLPALALGAMSANAAVISETPEGTLYENVYIDNDYTFLTQGSYIGYNQTEGGRTKIVVDETGGFIYIHNVIEFFPSYDAWIKGEIADDGTVTFPMPQEIKVDEAKGTTYSVNMLLPHVDGATVTLLPNTEAPDLVMKWDGKTLSQIMPDQTMPESYERYLGYIGVVSSSSDNPYYGQSGLNYEIFSNPVSLPDGIDFDAKDYSVTYETETDQSATLRATIYREKDGNGIWISGLNRADSEQMVAATEDTDGNLTLVSGQFMGYTEDVFTFFYGCDITRNDKDIPTCEWTDDVVLKLEDGKYVAQGDMIINVGNRKPEFGFGLQSAVFTALDDIDYVPSAPVIEGPEDDGTEVDYEDGVWMYALCFYLDPISENGEPLDASRLYYTVHLNGEQVPVGMEEEMMEVPFGYNNDMDVFFIDVINFNMVIGFAFEEVETLGVQAFYKNISGEVTSSELVTWENPSAGVANVSADSPVVSTEYFDMTGRSISEPSGLCIRRITRANGTVETAKTIVRK